MNLRITAPFGSAQSPVTLDLDVTDLTRPEVAKALEELKGLGTWEQAPKLIELAQKIAWLDFEEETADVETLDNMADVLDRAVALVEAHKMCPSCSTAATKPVCPPCRDDNHSQCVDGELCRCQTCVTFTLHIGTAQRVTLLEAMASTDLVAHRNPDGGRASFGGSEQGARNLIRSGKVLVDGAGGTEGRLLAPGSYQVTIGSYTKTLVIESP